MKILIIEDNSGDLCLLERILAEVAPESEVAATADSVASAVKLFENPDFCPDLILSDIVLADGLSFSVATLNEADWRFYNFINSYTSAAELSEPVITVSNVVGGSGYVTALGMSDLVMELKPLDWSLQ